MIVGIFGLLLYGAGIPLGLLIVLVRNRHSLHDQSDSKYHMTEFSLGSFYKAYEQKWFYWEVVVVVEKMLLVGLLSVVQQYSPVQLLVGTMVCFVYALVALHIAPYVGKHQDMLSFLCTLSLSIMYISGLLVALDEKESLMTVEVVSQVLVVVGVVPILAFLWSVIATVKSTFDHQATQPQVHENDRISVPASSVVPVQSAPSSVHEEVFHTKHERFWSPWGRIH